MNNRRKMTSLSVLAVLVFIVLMSMFAGSYMVRYALLPENTFNEEEQIAKLDERYPGLSQWTCDLMESGQMRDTTIMMDGVAKHAYLINAASPSAKTAVTIHGYTSNPIHMMSYARMFRDSLGYNVIVPHLNHHGFSGGRSIQMGWKDRLDIIKWIDAAHNTFKDSIMVVHGVSMGGATTMMVSGEQLPDFVKGFIEDCGYTSVFEQYSKEIKERFHIPAFPVLYAADLITWLRYGWSFKEASSVAQLAKCRQPMMFIHGDSDDFVPSYMLGQNYDAKTQGYKEMWSVPGVPHAESHHLFPEEYTARVRKFLKEQVE